MQHIDVRIHRKNDPDAPCPELTGKVKEELTFTHCVILERGTENGNTSLAFFLCAPSGEYYWAQLTLALTNAIMASVHGAEQHWKETPQ